MPKMNQKHGVSWWTRKFNERCMLKISKDRMLYMVSEPTFGQYSHLIPPENIKIPKFFCCFQGVKNNGNIGQKSVYHAFLSHIYLCIFTKAFVIKKPVN